MGYYLTIKNDLLEPKHVERMGASVWLFMLLLDKVMAINENGIGKVLNGRPVVFEEHIQPILGISERTYRRWLQLLKDNGYVRTTRTPYGLVIYVNKAEKMWGQKAKTRNTELFTDDRPAKIGTSKVSKDAKRPVKNGQRDRSKMANPPARNDRSNNDNSNDNNINNNITTLARAPEKSSDAITKLYYEAVKALGLPVTNHTTLHKKIAQMKDEASEDELITYLTFMRDKYSELRPALNELDYQPNVTEALDIYSKRLKVVEAFQRLAREQQQTRVWRPKTA